MSDFPSPIEDPAAWMDHAACLGADPELFFAPEPASGDSRGSNSYDIARSICASCSVIGDCWDEYLSLPKGVGDHGFWAGTSPQDRRQARRGRIHRTPVAFRAQLVQLAPRRVTSRPVLG